MNIKTMLLTLIFGLALTTTSYANDKNLSFSAQTLQGQAISSTIKKQEYKKYEHLLDSEKTNKDQKTKIHQPFSTKMLLFLLN